MRRSGTRKTQENGWKPRRHSNKRCPVFKRKASKQHTRARASKEANFIFTGMPTPA
jgi:hypothetical protein